MKTIGIVAEYNPFHNGHLYQLQASRGQTGADCAVVVMSGNYTQRGEPAIVDKWARAEMALHSGADLVIELPVAYAMGSAEYFAYGAVKLLDSLNAVNMICFGSEAGSIEKLSAAAAILADEPESYKSYLKDYLSKGLSFPAARQKAISSYCKNTYGKDDLSSLLKSPNNILGIEYLKALRRLKSNIVPMTIERVGNEYNQAELTGKMSSATSIRKTIRENTWNDARELLQESMPQYSIAVMERQFEAGRGPIFPETYEMPIISALRRMTIEQIKLLPYMEQGLENRLKLAAEKAGSYPELLDMIGTRRYTDTRIQRILFSILISLTKERFDYFNSIGGPAYIRILGFSRTGRKLLASIRGTTALPLITKTADHKNSDIPGVADMLAMEAAATDQYVLGCQDPHVRKSGSDYTRNVVFYDTAK
jgi:predicted nucleotidyltransferase